MAEKVQLFDAGLQLERTQLAWGRTALGFIGNAALVARAGTHAGAPAYVLAAALALTGVIIGVTLRRRYAARAAALAAGRSVAGPQALRALCLLTTSVAVAATLLVVLG